MYLVDEHAAPVGRGRGGEEGKRIKLNNESRTKKKIIKKIRE
jgi:hypothetical protein